MNPFAMLETSNGCMQIGVAHLMLKYTTEQEIPYGYCHCGCGQKTRKSPQTGMPCIFKNGHQTTENKFWSRINKNGSIPLHRPELGHCWEWIGGFTGKYGSFKDGIGNRISAHRFSWELAFGNIPEELIVCHSCDNPKCVNPSHLFLGTHQDNTDDMNKKARGSYGENRPASKLTWKQVDEIREKHRNGQAIRALGREYNISQRATQAIIRRQTWKYKCRRCNDTGILLLAGDSDTPCPVCGMLEQDIPF